MLKRIHGRPAPGSACVKFKNAEFPEPFRTGLEYSSPARGTWNIVHTGMLVPDSHQIYVCAAGCLRGVVLTAAEMGEIKRFSTIAVRENNILQGNMETLLIDGVTDILNRLSVHPQAVLIFTACIHHFLGCDLPPAYTELRKRFPHIAFAACSMDPIMRKSGLTADQACRRQIYSFLQPQEPEPQAINLIGNDLPTLETSELIQLVRQANWTLRDITLCHTYREYQDLAKACLNIYYNPAAKPAIKALEKRLGQKSLYVPLSYNYEEITSTLQNLARALGLPPPNYHRPILEAESALLKAKALIGTTPIALDYTLTFRPLSLARLLLSHDFNLLYLYTDSISPEEAQDFDFLQTHYPDLLLYSTKHPNMRLTERHHPEKILALGQKAAYFTGTNFFVNLVETGGLYGFDGIIRLADLMCEAFITAKNTKLLIQQKGWGCTSCL